MENMTEWVKETVEKQVFGVCAWWGDKLGIRTADIRMFFIYASFLTVGSPIILYLIMAFWKKMGTMLTEHKRSSVWDL